MQRLERNLLRFLIVYLFIRGFASTYEFVWRAVGLPYGWWSVPITAILGGLSTWGLMEWIRRADTDGP